VEDNIEVDNSHPEIGESGYSSEKASAVTSPVSPTDYHHHLPNSDFNSMVSPGDSNVDNSNLDPALIRHPANINVITSPSSTDVSMMDLTQIKMSSEKTDGNIDTGNSENKVSAIALTSSIINSDVMSSEVPVASLSSSAASKETPTSPVNDEEVTERLNIQMFKCLKYKYILSFARKLELVKLVF